MQYRHNYCKYAYYDYEINYEIKENAQKPNPQYVADVGRLKGSVCRDPVWTWSAVTGHWGGEQADACVDIKGVLRLHAPENR